MYWIKTIVYEFLVLALAYIAYRAFVALGRRTLNLGRAVFSR